VKQEQVSVQDPISKTLIYAFELLYARPTSSWLDKSSTSDLAHD